MPAPRPAPRLAALVVTYNRAAQIRRTVEALLASGIDHLLVVDNASDDGSTDFLAKLDDPRFELLRQPQNRGGAGGFEAGLRHLVSRYDPDWCVVMDDDARPEPGAIARFLAAEPGFARTGWEAIAAGVRYPDGAICEMNRPGRNPFWDWRSFVRTLFGGGRGGFHLKDSDYAATEPVVIHNASFVGLFLSRAAIGRVGYPEGDLFIYGDDVIYTLNLTRAGGAIGFAPWIGFEHDCSAFHRPQAQGQPKAQDTADKDRLLNPLWKVYYNYRNGLFAYRLAAGPLLFWPVLLVVVPKWLMKARYYGENRTVFRQLVVLAVKDALSGRRDRTHEDIRRASNKRQGT